MSHVIIVTIMHIKMRDLSDSEILAGALTGRKILGRLLERIDREARSPELVYLDFNGITLATASFLRECIVAFRDIVRRRWSRYYPVVANVNDSVAEELSILMAQQGVLTLCSLDEDEKPSSPYLVGNLEPKQRLTLELVKQLGEANAAELMRNLKDSDDVGKTAWNNRLVSLSRLGLLMEMSHGRLKRYKPLPL